jgi:hypothetical protein
MPVIPDRFACQELKGAEAHAVIGSVYTQETEKNGVKKLSAAISSRILITLELNLRLKIAKTSVVL